MAGLLIAAPSSGAGKSTITLGILRKMARAGMNPVPAKSGPDYIDPQFHAFASGQSSVNLDAWAMKPARLAELTTGAQNLVVEGAMGLFDGAGLAGGGSAADLAATLDLGIVLVLDCRKQSHSIAALVRGMVRHRTDLRFVGLILNQLGSARHEALIRSALTAADAPQVLAALHRKSDFTFPERHLGLTQAEEVEGLDSKIDEIAAAMDLDLGVFESGMRPTTQALRQTPPSQRIAVAQDIAFRFAYPHILNDWRNAGAEVRFFSPLANDAVPDAGFVFLPGGYPELHAGILAGNARFLSSLRQASETADVYGECGGYMVMGDGLIDADGNRHAMAGLLRLKTSFAQRKLHLGYRQLTAAHGPMVGNWRGHEFHYASTISAEGEPLFTAQDADGAPLPDMGLRLGRACGSFAHIIDRA